MCSILETYSCIHLAGCKEDNVDCRIHHEEERNMFLDKKITMYKLWRI